MQRYPTEKLKPDAGGQDCLQCRRMVLIREGKELKARVYRVSEVSGVTAIYVKTGHMDDWK
jgi:hypothetical protein